MTDPNKPFAIVGGARRQETWTEIAVEIVLVIALVAAIVSAWDW